MDMNTSELLFENIFAPDKIFVLEFCKCAYSKAIKIFCYIFFPLMVLFVFIAFLGGAENIITQLLIAFISVYFFFTPILHARQHSKKLLKQYALLASSDENTGSKTIFFTSHLESSMYGRTNTFYYNQVSRVMVGKLGAYLLIEKSLYVMVKKDAFTKGDYESFIPFLKEKLKDNPKALRGLK